VTLPVAVIMIVPMCLVAAISGVILRGQDNNILTQVGFVVLIGLAAKNAILIVEFAKQLEDQGRDRFAAAVEAARLAVRPIPMTPFAFIFGVMPLVWAIGAGAELRQMLGTAVFAGMIGVTAFGLVFTPIFYVVCRWIAEKTRRRRRAPEAPPAPAEYTRHATGPTRVRRSANLGFGGALGRKEGGALLGGAGRYVADHVPAGALQAVVLRSHHALARFRITDVAKGAAMPGVALVLTGSDTAELGDLPCQG